MCCELPQKSKPRHEISKKNKHKAADNVRVREKLTNQQGNTLYYKGNLNQY